MLRRCCRAGTVEPDADPAIEAGGIPLAVAWLGRTSADDQQDSNNRA